MSVNKTDKAMTVGELIDYLSKLDKSLPVYVECFDNVYECAVTEETLDPNGFLNDCTIYEDEYDVCVDQRERTEKSIPALVIKT